MIGEKEDRPAFSYLCKDLIMKHELEKKLVERATDQNMPNGDIFDAMQGQGIFVLIASRKISKDNLLPLYYTRDQVEKIFDLCKQDTKILPLNANMEAAFRGHLMTFISAVTLKMMSDKLKKTSLTTVSMFMNLHEQHAIIYDKEFITTEPIKKMNEACKAFKVQCPATIER